MDFKLNTEFILYVKDQKISRDFYAVLLGKLPVLDVEGMTEFLLHGNTKLGLMPTNGIKKILHNIADPDSAGTIPRCELYLLSDNAGYYCNNAIAAGAAELSPLQLRNWGDKAAYYSDPDGHIIAIAERAEL